VMWNGVEWSDVISSEVMWSRLESRQKPDVCYKTNTKQHQTCKSAFKSPLPGSSPSFSPKISPMATPATEVVSGTPASSIAKQQAQTVAIDEEPHDSVMSDSARIE
jgi:hypothetical protein